MTGPGKRQSMAGDAAPETPATNKLVIKEPADPFKTRLPFLIFGMLSLGIGALGLFQFAQILAGARAWPELWGWGLAITLLALCFGGVFAWVFFIPAKTVEIDRSSQEVRYLFAYPFGLRRTGSFPLRDVGPARVEWQPNSDLADGGYWQLELSLPDGRTIKRVPRIIDPDGQKKEADTWKAEIEAMRR